MNDNIQVIKRRKIKLKAVIISLIIISIIGLFVYYIFQIRITNIYITGNTILSDQDIISLAQLDDYPNSMKNSSKLIKTRLEKNVFINFANVYKEGFFNEIYIKITENIPLFYYKIMDSIILSDGSKVSEMFDVPIVTNEISSDVYDEFIECMLKIKPDIMVKISEIKYDPNDIDKERFYLTMNDGNYVYVTLNKFESINNYINIVKTFNNKKGILYLDSGEFFEIFEETNE